MMNYMLKMNMKNTLYITLLAVFALLGSCAKDNGTDYDPSVFEGKLSRRSTVSLVGFEENRSGILKAQNVAPRDFIAWSTDPAWELQPSAQTSLKNVRTAIEKPNNSTLLQKVISLEDMPVYMNNTYGGTLGGFVSVAADMKRVSTMFDTYWGLRLDYEGTKFKPDGAGYAIIRFYSPAASMLTIPFCPEMGGTQPHAWPNTGGGFTASKLADGGYPEYTFPGYSAPQNGAELYEVTPEGRETLRSVYRENEGWRTNEIGAEAPYTRADHKVIVAAKPIRNGVYTEPTRGAGAVPQFITTYATYGGNTYIVRALIDGQYHLTTQTRYDGVVLEVAEKGIYSIQVPQTAIEKIWEEAREIGELRIKK